MSRSIKNKSFLAHACCQSEKKDKKLWHKVFRKKEKTNLSNNDLENYVTTHHKEVSNPWIMGKDGKSYYSQNHLLTTIKKFTEQRYKNKKERMAVAKKMFYRWIGK